MIGKKEGQKNIIISFAVLIFVTLFFRMQIFIENRIFGRLAVLFSLVICVFGLTFFFLKSFYSIKFNNGIGKYLFVFCSVSVVSTIINMSFGDSFVETFVNLTFYFVVYAVAAAIMSSKFDVQILSNCFFAMQIFFAITYFIFRIWYFDPYSVAINSVYFVIMLLPLVMINRNNAVVFFGITISLISAIFSAKRNAFLMVVVALILFFLITVLLKGFSLKRKFLCIILILIAVGISFYIYDKFAEQLELNIFDRLNSISVDDGAGRSDIYRGVISSLKEFSFTDWILGKGFGGVKTFSGIETSAHSDFLEIIYDYGVLGIAAYLLMIIKVMKVTFGMFRVNLQFAIAGVVCLTIFLFMSLFSHLVIYPTYFAYILIFWSVLCHENNAY